MTAAASQPGQMIGIVGGVGPYAGVDLFRKSLDQTEAGADQEHLAIVMLSVPAEIADRTDFLLGRTSENPAKAMGRVLLDLERMGASVAGIPCNTAHSPRIFEVIRRDLGEAGSRLKLVHMIEEVGRFVREHFPRVRHVGVLCTTGTYETNVYGESLQRHGLEVSVPDRPVQDEAVQAAIYDPSWGIKARPHPVSAKARRALGEATRHLQAKGVEAIVLGCSELPLAVTKRRIGRTAVIDANLVLARVLIREVCPERLKPIKP